MGRMKEEKRICLECGQSFDEKSMLKVGRKMYCKECAQELMEEQNKSKNNISGINIVNQQTKNNNNDSIEEIVKKKEIVEKSYKTTLILSIFLGWLGVDRFYVNHIGLGVLKLLIGLSFVGNISSGELESNPMIFIFLIWWIIDIIFVATKNIKYVKWIE